MPTSNQLSESSETPNYGASSEREQDIGSVLHYLIRRGHIRFIYDHSESESDDESLYDQCSKVNKMKSVTPQVDDPNPDTSTLEGSDLKQTILLHAGLSRNSQFVLSLFKVLRQREIGNLNKHTTRYSAPCFTKSHKCFLSSHFLPNKMTKFDKYQSKAFCGTFSTNGKLFLTACQDFNIRIYDTSSQKLFKTIWARDVGWSILDSDISPDGRSFVYSSWSDSLYVCDIYDNERHEALPLNPEDRLFCIFSLRFSQDAREILGGANDECVYIYDREINCRVQKIRCHEDDVNSVAFADNTSQILFSGGDDGLIKVWDRRTLNESNPKAVGIFSGHIDGITYIDSKNDGRHLISNCKDQTIKLWDMRVFSPLEKIESSRKTVLKKDWDYRWQALPKKFLNNRKKIESDTSLMTYRGHSVLQTLIRCHFSPEATTGQRYIYTGCASGRLIIYDVLTGKIVRNLYGHRGCVRDVSWHPYLFEIMSTSWDGSVIKWTHSNDLSFEEDEKLQSFPYLRRSKRIAERFKKL